MKKYIFILLLVCVHLALSAQTKTDSTHIVKLDEVIISSLKETSPRQMPISATILSTPKINAAQIQNVRDMSGIVPNFFIPDYGSAMSTTAYIRGVGSRNSGQSMGLYVDDVPYFDKSTFAFDFFDIRQIEVLRGSQGTLYGRNAESGIVNIYTLSPLDYQGTKISLTGGNYGLWNVKAAHYAKLNNKIGLSVSGYYNQEDGFFTNDYTHKSADDKMSVGGRSKLEWKISPKFKAQYALNFDYVDQMAFPYGLYDATTDKTANPNYNDEGSYYRTTLTNSLLLQYITDKWTLSSITSHQYFKDEMKMDNDFSAMSFFAMAQKQKQNAINEEIILKSNSKGNYQWSFGATGFIQQLDNDAPFEMKSDGIKYMLQPTFSKMGLTVTDTIMNTPGLFNTKTTGGALFHQSTYNIFKGLSLTAGLRIDYEKINLDYNTSSIMHLKAGPANFASTDTLKNNLSVNFSELLPKLALKYEWSNRQFVYGNVSRGYKAGGYNVQMFADLVSKAVEKPGSITKENVKNAITYNPEYSWNYEIGGQCLTFNDRLRTAISLFYINLNDVQITQFVPNGLGRKISNAGKAESKGIEVSVEANLGQGFSIGANYGYAKATFSNYSDSVKVTNSTTHAVSYKKVDYKGNYIPYAPQNTLSISGNYEHSFTKSFIDKVMACVQYTGVGKIYWNESNDMSQDFYSTVNAKLGVKKGAFGLELWGKNLFDTSYNAFYFYSSPSTFYQKGKPLQLGATLKVEF